VLRAFGVNLKTEAAGERTRLGCGFSRPRGKHRTHRNFRNFCVRHTRKRLDARRVQQHPGRVCSPTSECASPSAFAARHSAASARRRLALFGEGRERGRILTLPPILVGQSCCFALIEVSAKGDASANGQAKTSLRSFLRRFGRRGSDALPGGSARMRPDLPDSIFNQ
jgi:hypothetical protein